MAWRFEGDGGELVVDYATPDQAAPSLVLHRRVLQEGEWFITTAAEFVMTTAQRQREIEDLARSDSGCFLVATRGRSLLGFLTVHPSPLQRLRHTGKLQIMVDPAARGLGAGRALMEAFMDWGLDNPHLEKVGLAVFADNDRAVGLYRRFGFLEEGRRVREYRFQDGTYRDDLLMYRFMNRDDAGAAPG